MEIKTNIYTSCYSKMLTRHKNPNDIYIQVSRSLFLPKKGIDNKSMMSMIDLSYGKNLGMYESTLEEYESRIRGEEYKEILEELAQTFSSEFLLADMTEEEIRESEEARKELEKIKEKAKNQPQEQIEKFFSELTQEEKENYYLYGLTEETLKNISTWNPQLTFNFFILCFEDLNTKYTEKDEKKNSDCVAGTFKTCHRTILAKILNEKFNLNVTEW